MKPLELIESGRFLGEEFLIWLWHRGLAEGGTSGLEGDLSACFLDDAVVLVNERGDVKELSLRKGNPTESREAFEAMSRGMRPSKAKIRLLSGDMEWTFVLDSSTLTLSGLKLPPSQAKNPADRMADRLFLIDELRGHLGRRFETFILARVGDPTMQDGLQAWIERGLGGFDGEAPWEES